MLRITHPFLALSLCALTAVGAQDNCRDILVGGVFNSERFQSKYGKHTSADSFVCSEEFLSYASDARSQTGFGIVIEGIPLSFKDEASRKESLQRRATYCSKQNRRFAQQEETLLLRQLASPEITRAWTSCMSGQVSLVSLTSRPVGTAVQVTAKFSPAGNMQPPLITGVSAVSLQPLDGAFAVGTPIQPGAGLTGAFKRERNEEGLITLRTTLGDISIPVAMDWRGVPAGEYRYVGTTFAPDSERVGEVSALIELPERHNQDAQGFGPIALTVEEPFFLRNPSWYCEGRGDQRCGFVENFSMRQESDQRVVATGTHRSRSTRAGIVAVKFKRSRKAVQRSHGPYRLTYGSTFTVRIPETGDYAVEGRTESGDFVFNPRDFGGDDRFEKVSQARIGDEIAYTFRVRIPSAP